MTFATPGPLPLLARWVLFTLILIGQFVLFIAQWVNCVRNKELWNEVYSTAFVFDCSCLWAAAGRAPGERPLRRTAGRARRRRCPPAGRPWLAERCPRAPAATPAPRPPPAAIRRASSSPTLCPARPSAPVSMTTPGSHSPPTRGCPAPRWVSTEHRIPPPIRTPTRALASTVRRSTRRWYVCF